MTRSSNSTVTNSIASAEDETNAAVWVSLVSKLVDNQYIVPMAKGFIYLVAVMDWYSRKWVVWCVSICMVTSVCLDALEEAIDNFGVTEIFNTD